MSNAQSDNRNSASGDKSPEAPDRPNTDSATAVIEQPASSEKVEWPEGIKRLMVQNWITTEDLGFSERNKLSIVSRAKNGDSEAIQILNRTMNVLLELMGNDTEQRQMVNDRGRPLYVDESGALTTEPRSETKKDLDGRLIEYEKKLETRSRHAIRRGRETGTGPGGKWIRPAEWKLRVQEHFHDLFPQLRYREHAPAFPAGQFGKVQGVVEYAKQKHAEGMDKETGYERQETLKWLNEFLKNPQTTWDGET